MFFFLKVVEDISDMRSLENGNISLHFSVFGVSEVVQKALKRTSPPSSEVSLSYEVESEAKELKLYSDAHRLEQVRKKSLF